jgi:Domain of unknown function (DUF1854)
MATLMISESSDEARRSLSLEIDESGQLFVADDPPVPVRVRQCFPWSDPHRHLSLRDASDQELALVDDPAALDEASRAAMERALGIAGFVLEVTRVMEIDEEVEIRQWSVETTSGARSFQTHLDDWLRALPDGGLLIRDVAGDLYKLGAPHTLDRKTRDLLWAFVDL